MRRSAGPVRIRQRLGKYRIERRLGDGGFAVVYQALDTIEGIRVALKIPHTEYVTTQVLDDFRREVRLAAPLQHANILPLKNAEFIEDRFVVAFPLGERTLADRLGTRMSVHTALHYAEQMISALAYAHEQRVIHCDIKPENLILFSGNRLMLSDFGIARVAQKTIHASGSGTVGYVAPEQAMGRPSFRSDLFSAGLIVYRMLSGYLPEWPFDWPPPGHDRLRRTLHPDLIAILRRSIRVDPRKRYGSAARMLEALRRVKLKAVRHDGRRKKRTRPQRVTTHWRALQRRQFLQQYRRVLATRYSCKKCNGPVSEAMHWCPWCGGTRKRHREETTFPRQCPRCSRGLKLDWKYCPWCYGAGFEKTTDREYSDVRYEGRCHNGRCRRKLLMPFMRYCPWCRHKVRRAWKIEGSKDRCRSCGWGVAGSFWSHCAWCGRSIRSRQAR